MQHICKICNHELTNPQGLSAHCRLKHKMTAENVYIEYFLEGIPPTCKCGCSEKPKYLGIYEGFRDYIRGHASRVNNNWGHNPIANKKSHETQKKMYESGELVVWNKGLDITDDRVRKYTEAMLKHPTRNEKISKTLTGRKRLKEVLDRLQEGMLKYWSKEENREKKSHERMVWMSENDFTVKSKLEETFLNFLEIDHIRQYYVRDIKSYFDFYIPSKNIMIEVDGDFWHCNPNGKFPKPLYEAQHKNIEKDKIKTDWCHKNNITLLRFWEKDINNNPEMIKSELSRYL